jgi:hypothetical protein
VDTFSGFVQNVGRCQLVKGTAYVGGLFRYRPNLQCYPFALLRQTLVGKRADADSGAKNEGSDTRRFQQ